MKLPSTPPDFNKLIFWTLSNAIGWSLGLGIGFALWYENIDGIRINRVFEPDLQSGDFLEAVVIGVSVTILQSIFIYLNEHQTVFTIKWAASSIAGIFFGILIAGFLGQPMLAPSGGLFSFFTSFSLPPVWYKSDMGLMDFQLGGPLTGAILGGILALSQVLLLAKRLSSKVFWIIASSLGLELAFILTIFVSHTEVLLVGAIVGTIYGLFTVVPLRNLLRPQK